MRDVYLNCVSRFMFHASRLTFHVSRLTPHVSLSVSRSILRMTLWISSGTVSNEYGM
jgi:hypothetical protein